MAPKAECLVMICIDEKARRRIHERTIMLRFLGILLKVLRFPYTMFLTISDQGVEDVKSVSKGDCE